MPGWIIPLVIVGILAVIPFIPVGVFLTYDAKGLDYRICIGPVRFKLKGKKKDKESTPKLKKDVSRITKKAKDAVTKKDGGDLSQFKPLLQAIVDLLADLRRKIRVKKMELDLIMGGDDPCSLALNYGRAWAAVGNLVPLLEQIFTIKKRNVQVHCDFTSQSTKVYLRLYLTMALFRLVSLLVKYGVPLYREYEEITKTDEGGAEQ